MPAGLNSTELNDFAPAWVPEPNGRGLLRIVQPGEVVRQGELTLASRDMEYPIQLLLYALVMRRHRYSHECGTGRGNHSSVVR